MPIAGLKELSNREITRIVDDIVGCLHVHQPVHRQDSYYLCECLVSFGHLFDDFDGNAHVETVVLVGHVRRRADEHHMCPTFGNLDEIGVDMHTIDALSISLARVGTTSFNIRSQGRFDRRNRCVSTQPTSRER